ncbi:receptor-like protein EIX2 [Zingiber officinale]|uniref:receptor-like protein EIX2 n=1 Tax=Zingiber officinale TaxID=94328 RepID=UPI001C4DB233|nr:receptor-like protein EIX2 [Zingiber officinale]
MPLHSFYYSLLLCGLIMSLAFSFKEAAVATPTRGCSEVERDALLSFKANVKDPSHRLASWSPQIDCCKWSGVVCKTTDNASLFGGQHVVEINLQNPYVDTESFFVDPQTFLASLRGEIPSPFQTALQGEMLSPSLLNLTRLERLNLSWNDFGGTPIPKFIGSFLNLKYLELYGSNFAGVIPSQLGNLSSLYHLGLGSRWYVGAIAPRLDWLSGLSSLRHLDLSSVNLSTVSQNWLSEVNMVPSLQELYLYGCDLNHIPSSFNSHLNLTSLKILNLEANLFSSSLPNWLWRLTSLSSLTIDASGLIPAGISNLTRLIQLHISGNISSPLPVEIWSLNHLMQLDLSSNNMLTGPIPTEIANLSSLQLLFLSDCSLNGQMPSEIGNLRSLISLDLSFNSLSGPIPTEIGNLTSLISLDISFNSLSDPIPTEIGNLTSLINLNLSFNSLSGLIPTEIGNLSSLVRLHLTGNSLSGSIPTEIGKLSKLQSLTLQENSLVSVLSESHLANLTNLKTLTLRENSQITISFDYDWAPSFQLETIDLASCIVGPRFPQWLRSQKSMFALSLSNTSINDILPHWLWNSSSSTFWTIDLSNNKLRGTLPSSMEGIPSLQFLNLRSNKLEGLVPRLPPRIFALDLSFNDFSGPIPSKIPRQIHINFMSPNYLILSNNHINGSIPSFICKWEQLRILDLSYNRLSGEIPKCWQEANTNLDFIHLGNNKLTGEIPSSIGNLIGLASLHLDNNDLSGQLPMSLKNCTKLHVIDLRGNNFIGSIPTWIGQSLQQLTVLKLRSNMFSGIIPSNLGELSNLQILDLANNNLRGSIPYSFGNFSAIRSTSRAMNHSISIGGADLYIGYGESDSLSIVTKGFEYVFSSILYLVKIIDLSNNSLTGEFPMTFGSLVGLQTLNLSRNFLRGRIPYTIGEMKSLETLDLSFNNLSGNIPSGYQLQTLQDASIYKGNAHLCGVLINKRCSTDVGNNVTKEELQKSKSQIFLSIYFGTSLGYVIGLWSLFVILLSKQNWRNLYFQLIDRVFHKVHVPLCWRSLGS